MVDRLAHCDVLLPATVGACRGENEPPMIGGSERSLAEIARPAIPGRPSAHGSRPIATMANTCFPYTGPARFRLLLKTRYFHAAIPVALWQGTATPKQGFAVHVGWGRSSLSLLCLPGIPLSSRCSAAGSTRAARQPRTASLGSNWCMARVAAT